MGYSTEFARGSTLCELPRDSSTFVGELGGASNKHDRKRCDRALNLSVCEATLLPGGEADFFFVIIKLLKKRFHRK